jgi:lysophospholipase L1-like esterase
MNAERAVARVATLLAATIAIGGCGKPAAPTFSQVLRAPMEADAELGWKPQARYSSYSGTFLTGEHGLRMNREEIVAPARRAIIAVGDSFTAGSEVGNGESWPAHLERLLKVPVLNAASGAWGVDQMVLRAEALAPTLEPALVIIGILDQDVLRNNFRLYGGGYKPYFTIEGGQLVQKGTPVPSLEGASTDLGWVKAVLGRSYALDWSVRQLGLLSRWVDDARRYDKVHDDGPEVSRLLLRRLAESGQKHGFKTMMVMLYGGGQILASPTRPSIVEPSFKGADEAGMPAIDMYPVLRERVPGRLDPLYVMHESGKVHGHMSSAGNELVARTIAARIAELGWTFEPVPARAAARQ